MAITALDFAQLLSILSTARGKYQTNDPQLYQVLTTIIKGLQSINSTDLTSDLEQAIIDLQKELQTLESLTFLTSTDESTTLLNSRELLAGTGITFDDTVANQRTINASAVSFDFVVVSDGGNPAVPINDGLGSFIYVPYE